MTLNKVQLIGRLGRNPDIKTTQTTGKKVANFSIATRDGKAADGTELVTWHNIVLFDKLANLAEQYLHKGDQVFIEGRISHREYTGKDGTKKTSTEIIGFEMKFLEAKKTDSVGNGATPAASEPATLPAQIVPPGEIPF